MFPDHGIYNTHLAWTIPSDLDINLLQRAIAEVSKQHTPLRTLYVLDKDGQLKQQIYDQLPIQFEIINLSSLSDAEINDHIETELHRPFRLDKEVAMRWVLFLRDNADDVLTIFQHHINVDLWGFMAFVNDLESAYTALRHGKPVSFPPLERSYIDFVEEQRRLLESDTGKSMATQLHARLDNMSQVLELPTDMPRPPVRTCNKTYAPFTIEEHTLSAFVRATEPAGVSPFVLFETLFHVLLMRYSEQQDVSIAVPTAGRDDRYRGIYGYFSNAVIVRSLIDPTISFNELLKLHNDIINQALATKDYPFPALASQLADSRDPSRAPLVQISFIWESINRFENRDQPKVFPMANGYQRWQLGEMGEWIRLPRTQQVDDFDLTFKVYRFKDQMDFAIEYNTDLFSRNTIERMTSHFHRLMQSIIAHPNQSIQTLEMLTATEKQQILHDWNQTQADFEHQRTLVQQFEYNVKKQPDSIAVRFENRSISFAELDIMANQVAALLLNRKLHPEARIGVFLERSPEVVASFLGILKAGGCYLPLDPEYPPDRLAFIIDDAKPQFIISRLGLSERIPNDCEDVSLLQWEDPELSAASQQAPGVTLNPNQLAYLIYTSGSTGKPKGVMIEHGGLSHLMETQRDVFNLGQQDIVLQFASLNFDASLFEICAALHSGACLQLARKESLFGTGLIKFLEQNRVSWAVLPPALLASLPPAPLPHLKTLIVAGDACSMELARKWSEGRRMYNGYGPTECSVWATCAEINGTVPPPIGRPLVNTQIYILDAHLNPQPVGIPGELHIGGAGLARGYLNRPDLTSEKFIANPFSDDPNARLYKTGDLARYLPDGNIEFLGRLDHQVKVRGFRIELGEIETVLREHNAVHDVLVMAREDVPGLADGEKMLVAYIVKNASEKTDGGALREFLNDKLPGYMIPAAFVMLDAFPLTPNEKIDRKALPLPGTHDRATRSHDMQAPRNEIERVIAGIWKECLGLSDISIRENFFDLGGHSLLLAKVHARLPAFLQQKLTIVDLYKYPTIQSLAQFVDNDIEEDAFFVKQDEHAERMRLRRRLMASISGVKIAIVGMAGRFPGADTVDEFWHNLCEGRESITFFTPEQLREAGVPDDVIRQSNYVPAKGVLDDVSGFDAGFFNFTPREAQITDPQQRLFLECAWQALEDGGCVPSKFKGRIGVYGGVGINQYLVNNLAANPQLLASVGDYPIMLGNDKDFLCTRVSYKLNLDGPAMVVQTACSTSLVAVHTACQALLSEECDAALAGGVSMGRLGNSGYFYHDGMIMSPDGHCRAFDAGAAGTVQGQGCGIVLLKRLDDALRDNDHIYAVISGSATNNDGSNKTGYTAPSVEGQAKAIRLAQASANIKPTDISYIETHGTGTPIGDPIEIEALRQTFRDDNTGTSSKRELPKTCAIGSVKTNIGHLDAASGIAGLIKTAKAIEQQKLPPSLHFESPNPKINFAASPFYVNTQLQDWNPDGAKRYAAVSSFGMGGTNAHVILTQAPSETPAEVSRPWRLVTLSARSASALEAMTDRLVEHLKHHPDQSFSNVCYTLHVGRTLFPHRRHLVCRNREDAIVELTNRTPRQVINAHYRERTKKIVFLFSGQGSQYITMGKHLYQVELEFRKVIDECLALLSQKFVHVYEELSLEDSLGLTDKIHQTYITQPGLFVFEYAMATMLMKWGIKPDYMLGHSVGEYVAACLAGVFTLDQALELVAIRGQLMQQLEPGEMLSVRLSEEEALLLTNHDVSLAAVNGERRCVMSGSAKAIRYLHEQLNKKGVENRLLHTSHAFHSHMMDPILDRFAAYVERRKPKAPTMPFVSSLTGEWITPEQATSPRYWADHLRHSVRFHQGLNSLFSRRDETDPETALILMEVGPGNVLTTLTRQNTHRKPQDWMLATTRHAYEDVSDTQHLLRVIGRLWQQGVDINWDEFHSQRQRYRVPLPTYPFERQPYWVDGRSPVEFMAHSSDDNAQPEAEPDIPAIPDAVAPRDDVEELLWQAWCSSLGRTDFGIYDNFFDLGGDSLLAVNLVDQLQKTFQVPLSTPVLIQKPSIAELAEYIQGSSGMQVSTDADGTSVVDNSPLIMIQRGRSGEAPLLMVHPIGGEVFFYRDLARHLGIQQPLYAFQAPSLSGAEPPMHSVYTLAERYISELKIRGFKPPYLLGGSSFGGLVAYEMAQQLSAADEEVRLLVMIDTPTPAQMPANLTDSAAILHYLLADKLPLSLEVMRTLDAPAQVDYVLDQARIQGKGDVLPPHLGVALFNTWIAHQEATFAYEPKPYSHDVLFFRHSEPMENFPPLPHLPWVDLMEGKVEIHQVPGNHVSMNYPPHVKVLAEHLKTVLRKYV